MPKAGLYQGGLLKSLIGAAIPPSVWAFSLSLLYFSLSLFGSIHSGLCIPLTLY